MANQITVQHNGNKTKHTDAESLKETLRAFIDSSTTITFKSQNGLNSLIYVDVFKNEDNDIFLKNSYPVNGLCLDINIKDLFTNKY